MESRTSPEQREALGRAAAEMEGLVLGVWMASLCIAFDLEASWTVIVCSAGSPSICADRREEGSGHDFRCRECSPSLAQGSRFRGEGLGRSRTAHLLPLPNLLGLLAESVHSIHLLEAKFETIKGPWASVSLGSKW